MSDDSHARLDAPPVPQWLRLLGEAAAMLRFYSRLPLPALGPFDDPAAPPPFARACRMLPVASLVIAAPQALVVAVLGLTALPALFVATMSVAAGLIATGALHEDGLADMADGFGGGATVARKLEIMKDSRVGSYGVAALALALLARTALVAALLLHGPLVAATSLLGAGILSRGLSLALFAALPAARPDGVASAVGRPEPAAVTIACLLTLGLVGLAALPWLTEGLAVLRLLTGLLVVAAVTLAVSRLALRQIGGQTGDVLGAAQVLAEIGFLAGLLAI